MSITNLKKYFKDVKAVDGISFEIKPGEIYGLLGPNGAGKTTTIKNILGILEQDAGKISVCGMDPTKNKNKAKSLIGYVAEDPLVYQSLTPKEFFEFIISIRKLDVEKTKRILYELLESLEAKEYINKPIVSLSKGNIQKIQIISALIHEPELLIMDEPLSGLDARSGRIVKDILKIHRQNGGSVLFSTHIMDIAEDLCDRIGILNKGQIIAEGTMSQLRSYAKTAGADSLEDIFLNLTKQDDSIQLIVNKLKETMQ